MLLIDSSQVHIGGALVLLDYLIEELKCRKIEYVIIIDKRCKSENVLNSKHKIISTTFLMRKYLYSFLRRNYNINSVLSLNSFAAPIRITEAKTVTYFHNSNLLSKSNFDKASIKFRISQTIKRFYLRLKLLNSDYYVFQSNLVAKMFIEEYHYPEEKSIIAPFYDDSLMREIQLNSISKVHNRFCFISIPYSHKNHNVLLEAWSLLLEEGVSPELILTIPEEYIDLVNIVNNLNKKGAKILNLGIVSARKSLEETAKSEYCIYPSLSESLGLGLVEAQKLGCKIIAADMDYVDQVIVPSLRINPRSAKDIKEKVLFILKSPDNVCDSKLLMKNEIEKLINILI